ncbi:conserved hypothetical protein [Burkholderia pseudomallei MSHR346]|nr:conserved hypothetical protein [Burkholderia pseudomallei MSHR346]EEC35326.1 conserved hypothetical protein [Burkholderia pseudomallei 576]
MLQPHSPRSRFSVFFLFCFASPIGTACVRFAAFNLSAARSVADTISR